MPITAEDLLETQESPSVGRRRRNSGGGEPLLKSPKMEVDAETTTVIEKVLGEKLPKSVYEKLQKIARDFKENAT